jgi:hypothetical protein
MIWKFKKKLLRTPLLIRKRIDHKPTGIFMNRLTNKPGLYNFPALIANRT